MKSAIYIQDGLLQFVLTPETEVDKKVLDKIEKAKGLTTCRGSFYECQGGWMRYRQYGINQEERDESLIFVVREEQTRKDLQAIPDVTGDYENT